MAITLNGSAGVTTNSGAVYDGISRGTAVTLTTQTVVDFTSIPSWVKRITVIFNGVSLSGTSNFLMQIGTGGTPTTSGYSSLSSFATTSSSSTGGASSTAGYVVLNSANANFATGNFIINNITGNIWIASGVHMNPNVAPFTITSAGSGSLSGVLNMVRITTVNGTDTFDAGSINIMYE